MFLCFLCCISDGNLPPENNQEEVTTNWDECTTTFDLMDLKEDLLRGIYAYGFEKPSAIQQVSLDIFSLFSTLNNL